MWKAMGDLAETHTKKGKVLYRLLKRFFDIVISTLALVVCSPLFLIFKVVYLFGENKGPMLYKQLRVGKNGKQFLIYKFRSMVNGADNKLKANPRLYQKYLQNDFKLPVDDDPRITHFGHFIRLTSLDEIPQFINVLKGEMSLVGPRPIVEAELKNYDTPEHLNKFLSVKPGITGCWQAFGRNKIGYPKRCNVELYYVDHASLLFDLKIIVKSFSSVLKHDGVY
ncbi:sugar transferase [Bombilactobacillus bombi]|uniref:Sugar transferase n=2 Tax=Bombilactobacillus bombi TaxID=1303590 RepID=A0A417ZFU6_9LACO|nr:sugar transferase [Bombilactobacillus bombi]